MRRAERVAAAALLAATCMLATAAPAPADDALEARTMALSAELRCLVCQNQTIADSNAPLAVDLRDQVREQLRAGRSERQVITHLTDRYGDFVLYRPPVKGTTALLWAGPALLFAGALGGLAMALRRRQRTAPDAFEAAPDDLDDRHAADAPLETAR